MTVTRRTTTAVLTAVAAAAFAVSSNAFAGPAPDGGPASPSPSVSTSATGRVPSSGGRTDEQFWGQATWLNPLSGLNLDRSSVAH
jgi:hypothetical protein